ncbi:MAG: quinol:cytochrome c oxidoreductase iron-sulfur protein precursor [Fibrobacteria bacterium]|jgi:molybdopterin-containing oxidoreductase family iron-sulfur binding subunit|nr:quinol:cytochrome c oxidoreductase iron-sulfur protein precursor [Fibrobacteria bacterium]
MSSLNLDPKQAGKATWKSLEELAGAPEFKEFAGQEFPDGADTMGADISRRRFLQVMGAGMAFAGVTGCKGIRRPEQHILPYNNLPENLIPGVPQYYATSLSIAGDAVGLIVEAHEGRPTKIEGNPAHPANRGATSKQHQSILLDLYNPERSQKVLKDGSESSWDAFWKASAPVLDALKQNGGEGLAFLAGYSASPSFRAVREHAARTFPKAVWYTYEPLNRDNVLAGMHALTGQALEPLYHFDKAARILSVDGDFLESEPYNLAYARDFAAGRNPDNGAANMNRLYVIESHFSVTGGAADHRLRVKPDTIPQTLLALARELKAAGLALPDLGTDLGTIPRNAEGISSAWLQGVAQDLLSHRGKSLVVVGKDQPAGVHAIGQALNAALGNVGTTVEWLPSTVHALNATDSAGVPENSIASLRALSRELDAGRVSALFILDANPAYASPAELAFGDKIALAKFSAHLGAEVDETAVVSQWHLPLSHFLETWSDTRSQDGTIALAQPLIAPLYETLSAAEVLARLSEYPKQTDHDIVKDLWANGSEKNWRTWLHDGIVSKGALTGVSGYSAAGISAVVKALPAPTRDLEILFREDSRLLDGRFANNAWLQEIPDPVTKLTWDNAVLMSPGMAEKLGIHGMLLNGEETGTTLGDYRKRPMVRVTANGRSLEAAAWVLPGMAENTLLLHTGFGRIQVGKVGEDSGFNAYVLASLANPSVAGNVKIEKIARVYSLACTQDHWSTENRPMIRTGDLAEYLRHPEEFASEEKWNEHPPEKSLWDEEVRGTYDFSKGMQWGMVIDLNSCTGCNACSIACQAENNIPTVGKEQVLRGREMHWLRLDRYFTGDVNDPQLEFQPMTCQQCENAPCEEVCPVAATVHTHEGLNDMVYNRCIGTKYCSNNCPFKVRRFNFFNYNNQHAETEKMRMNPDVTVRFRGVMEKCTYCVQRIQRARVDAKNHGSERIADGAVTPACGQACASDSIVFGDINDPNSRVSRLKKHPRNYGLLNDLNVKPRTSYLARVRNPNPALATQEKAGA